MSHRCDNPECGATWDLWDLAIDTYKRTPQGRSYAETGIQDSDDAEALQRIKAVLEACWR